MAKLIYVDLCTKHMWITLFFWRDYGQALSCKRNYQGLWFNSWHCQWGLGASHGMAVFTLCMSQLHFDQEWQNMKQERSFFFFFPCQVWDAPVIKAAQRLLSREEKVIKNWKIFKWPKKLNRTGFLQGRWFWFHKVAVNMFLSSHVLGGRMKSLWLRSCSVCYGNWCYWNQRKHI